MPQKYDAIIIGSGIGGLTCGAFLAKAGMRVLVLEQHIKIGGYAHSFKRRKFTFESGIHSVSMSNNGLIMHLLKLIGVDKKIETVEHPEMFSVTLPDFSMAIPTARDKIFDYLCKNFPDEKNNIIKLFKEVDLFYENIIQPQFDYENNFTGENISFVSMFHNKSYRDYIANIISDKKLQYLIYGQWPYVGSSPEYASNLFFFMMFLVHVVEGSHYCKNGFETLASALASVITEQGGEIKTHNRVTAIKADKKNVRGVKTAHGDEYEADIFISNISPYLIHNELLNKEARGKRWLKRLSNLKPSTSCVIVYLGMKPEYKELIPHNISFWYSSFNYRKIFSNILHNKKDSIDHLISLRRSEDSNYPTLTLMNFVQKSYSSDWKSEKMRIAEKMLKKAEDIYPGLNGYIELMEVGSPETFERYTGNTDGALYGFENTKAMYGEAKMPTTTHIDNLYQTGHWGKPGCSIWNVMSNAYTASKIILKNSH